jgi:hypothetical protein
MAKATEGEECAEVQTVGPGFIVTKKPRGTLSEAATKPPLDTVNDFGDVVNAGEFA